MDTLADTNLATASTGSGKLADQAAVEKEQKYRATATAMQAKHLPFAVETLGGLSQTAQQLIRETHHSAKQHCTRRDVDAIATHLVDSIAIAIQSTLGRSRQVSLERKARIAMGAAA